MCMGIWFIQQDKIAQQTCGVAGTPPAHHTPETWLEESIKPVDRVDLWCINTEIYDPFIWLLFPLSSVFFICGWIEIVAKEGKKNK